MRGATSYGRQERSDRPLHTLSCDTAPDAAVLVRRRGAHGIKARRSYEAFTDEAAYRTASVPMHALPACTLTLEAGPYMSQCSFEAI
jgi:hypothetical protein